MPAIIDHHAFVQPEDPTTRIWRYMDFAKLVALLQRAALYFPRLDQLSDPFEGSISRDEYNRIVAAAEDGERRGTLPEKWRGRYFDVLMANARMMRKSTYVNCWHFNGYESEAMWRLYAASGYAVALQSTYTRLVSALPAELYTGCYVGMVQYVDHHRETLPEGNAFHAVMHKRTAFKHEQEVRPVTWMAPREPDPLAVLNTPTGIHVGVNLPALVEQVYVSPVADDWFAETVSNVVAKYLPSLATTRSDLGRSPYR